MRKSPHVKMFPCWNVHLPEHLQCKTVQVPKCSRDETSMPKWLLPKGSVRKWSLGTWAPNTPSDLIHQAKLKYKVHHPWNKQTINPSNKQTSSPNNTNNSVMKTWNLTIFNMIQWDDGLIVPWSDGPMFILIYWEYVIRWQLVADFAFEHTKLLIKSLD